MLKVTQFQGMSASVAFLALPLTRVSQQDSLRSSAATTLATDKNHKTVDTPEPYCLELKFVISRLSGVEETWLAAEYAGAEDFIIIYLTHLSYR
jgi:hypothetical protein